MDKSMMPQLAPGAVRKRNVFDVIEALNKSNKKNVLIRVDFNVPMNAAGEITDDSRIRGALNTIQAVNKAGLNAVLCSHMGRPKLVQAGGDDAETNEQRRSLSLKPVAAHLSKLLDNAPVLFAPDCQAAKSTIDQLPVEGGGMVLLENLRFYKDEEKNGEKFTQTLASYADGYVNDAFGTSHRAHASVAGVPGLLPDELCGIGCLVASELAYLDFSNIKDSDQIAAIIGGSKVSTKLPVIQGLLKTVHILVLQGGLAFTFLAAQGISIGNSLVEESMVDTAKDLLQQAKDSGKTIILPVDAVCSQSFPSGPMDKSDTKCFDLTVDAGVENGWMGLDIGPRSVKIISDGLQKASKIIVNGPAGVFEVTPFDEGTRGLVDCIETLTKNGTISVVGGGDSVAALEQFGKTDAVSYVSTGGGATLELLAGDVLPGVAAIADYKE